jgi:hypothetical protein
MSHRTTQAALDAMQPSAQASYAAEVEETSLPLAPEENNGEAAGASPLGAEAGGASDKGEAGNASLESALEHERACGYERDLESALEHERACGYERDLSDPLWRPTSRRHSFGAQTR